MCWHRNIALAFLVIVNCFLNVSQCARILAVFPIPSISHQVVFRPLTLELRNRGHELTVLTTDPLFSKTDAPVNFTEIDLHDAYKMWREAFVEAVKGNSDSSMDMMRVGVHIATDIFEMEINNEEVKNLLNSKRKFDLLLLEAGIKPALIFSHIFNAPVIQISSLMAFPATHRLVGSPTHPVYYPEAIRKRLYNLSVLEKITGAIEEMRMRKLQSDKVDHENAMLRRNFGDDVPTVDELNDNVDMVFLNVNPMWDNNRPVSPAVVYLGGLHQKQPKELPSVS